MAKQNETRPAGRPEPRAVHGPGKRTPRAARGIDRLRTVLGLSDETSVEQVCDEAANRLEAIPK